MLGLMISVATRTAMEMHTYQFRGSTYHQSGGREEEDGGPSGGPIGNPLSSAVACTVMLDWDRQFLNITSNISDRLNILLCNIYKRYVDDQFGKHQATPLGLRWDPTLNDIVHSAAAEEEDRDRQEDARTMTLLQDVANSINPRIVMTVDYPSANPDGKQPCLDFKCWMGPNGEVLYEYYRKPMCPQSTIYARSALPLRTKRTVHVQEAIRILARCHPDLLWSTKAGHLTTLSARMFQSGYSTAFRATVFRSALAAFSKIQERAASGIRPVNRPDSLDRIKRTEDKAWKGTTWFRRGGGTQPPSLCPDPRVQTGQEPPGSQDDRPPGQGPQGQDSRASRALNPAHTPED